MKLYPVKQIERVVQIKSFYVRSKAVLKKKLANFSDDSFYLTHKKTGKMLTQAECEKVLETLKAEIDGIDAIEGLLDTIEKDLKRRI